MPPVIELEKVTTYYEGEKNSTLNGLDLSVYQGDFICVMGPNGCGKTTLLETVNGMLPCRGRVLVLGYDVCKKGPVVRSQVGYMIQAQTFPDTTPYLVKDVVIMGRYGRIGLLRRPTKDDWRAAREAADFMEIQHLWDRPVGKLSGGQTQRVMLARAMAKSPQVLLLDEPFSYLDYTSVQQVSSKICQRHRQEGLTTMMVVHDLNHVPSLCNRIVLLREGALIMDGSPEEVLPSATFRDAFSGRRA